MPYWFSIGPSAFLRKYHSIHVAGKIDRSKAPAGSVLCGSRRSVAWRKK